MNLSSRGSRRSLIRNLLAGLCLGAMAGGLAACGGAVGGGNAPRSVVIAIAGGTTRQATLRAYECLSSGLRALLYFDDGSVGDFTSRVIWSSSNPGAVQVSNADIPGPGGIYANGVLVPAGEGNAIITADYFGIVSQIAISVGTPQTIRLKSVISGNYAPLGRINPNRPAGSTAFTMAPGTIQPLAVTAFLDGVETDITKFATLGFQVPNDAVATINATNGSIIAGQTGGPVVPMASFPPCKLTTITDPANIVSMSVSPAQSIGLQPEFLPDSTQPISTTNPLPQLVVGNSERFKVIANLANGDQQDVSGQSTLSVAQNTTGLAQFGGTSGVNNLLFATAPGGPVIVQAAFDVGGSVLIANPISTSTRTRVLSTFEVCWTDVFTTVQSCPTTNQPAPFVQAGSLTPLKFHAIGNYGFDPDTQQFILQDVTRSTTWTSLDQSIATISNASNIAGEALGVQQGAVTIQALNAAAVNVPTKLTQLNVNGQQ